ncbi:MAG: site-specific integrase [Ilumatobacteraceae bacterium]
MSWIISNPFSAAKSETPQSHYRALVLLAAFGGLRRGELLALQRHHVDEVHRTIKVSGQAQRIKGRGRVVRETKSDAGKRTVALNSAVMAELVQHMDTYTAADGRSWVFVGGNGRPVREADLYSAWCAAAITCGHAVEAIDKAGRIVRDKAGNAVLKPTVHLHDLRHYAGTEAARAGYTTRELQARLGHGTTRAAMIYRHAAEERDAELAERVGADFAAVKMARAAEIVAIRAG